MQTFEWDGMPGHVIVETMTLEDLCDGRARLVTVSLFHTTESYAALDRVLAKLADRAA